MGRHLQRSEASRWHLLLSYPIEPARGTCASLHGLHFDRTMTMRPLLALLAAFVLAQSSAAQQLNQYTQYVFNHFSVNPAVAGSKECLDVRVGVRQQWMDFEGAPRSGWASLHGMIRAKGKPYLRNRHGFGAFVEADNA